MGLLVTSNRFVVDLSDYEYNTRFYYALNKAKTRKDPAGYGAGRPYVPPLQNP